jgi:hypothetical protein
LIPLVQPGFNVKIGVGDFEVFRGSRLFVVGGKQGAGSIAENIAGIIKADRVVVLQGISEQFPVLIQTFVHDDAAGALVPNDAKTGLLTGDEPFDLFLLGSIFCFQLLFGAGSQQRHYEEGKVSKQF